MSNVWEKLGEFGVIPVVKIENAEDAIPLFTFLVSTRP